MKIVAFEFLSNLESPFFALFCPFILSNLNAIKNADQVARWSVAAIAGCLLTQSSLTN